MTPKEKAKELVSRYYIICQEFTEEIQCSIQAKQCALILVHEIIPRIGAYSNYWIEVKEEIYKL